MAEPWTVLAVLEWTARKFADRGIEAARLEAQVLLSHALACTRVQLYTGFDKPLGDTELTAIRALIKRRLAGEPIAYLVGDQEFWSRTFAVDRHVLVPRRDTETVIEVVLAAFPDRARPLRGVDVGTGSGILAVTLAAELPASAWIAIDLSPDAAAVATRNAASLQVGDRVDVRTGDLLAPVAAEPPFDVIVSNPPYVRRGDLATLQLEVRSEPMLALDGGPDGLDVMRRLVAALPAAVAADGLVALEHGDDQGPDVRALLDATAAFTAAETRADLSGRPRVTHARRRGA